MSEAVFDSQKHWDKVFQSNTTSLGWYEATPEPSLGLIRSCHLPKTARILHVGAGATTLIDQLLLDGYRAQIAVDISSEALRILRDRLGVNHHDLESIQDDLVNPTRLLELEAVDLWHDRAVLHFLIEEDERRSYFELLRKMISAGGYVIIAVFNEKGAKMCSGLPVYRYNLEAIQDCLGQEFELLKSFDHTYTQPSGNTREFIYTLFNKKASLNVKRSTFNVPRPTYKDDCSLP